MWTPAQVRMLDVQWQRDSVCRICYASTSHRPFAQQVSPADRDRSTTVHTHTDARLHQPYFAVAGHDAERSRRHIKSISTAGALGGRAEQRMGTLMRVERCRSSSSATAAAFMVGAKEHIRTHTRARGRTRACNEFKYN